MNDDKARAVRALRLLGRRVRHGLPKLAPVSEQHLAKVRAAVREQWQAKQQSLNQTEGHSAESSASAAKRSQTQKKTKSQSKSHDHGHSE